MIWALICGSGRVSAEGVINVTRDKPVGITSDMEAGFMYKDASQEMVVYKEITTGAVSAMGKAAMSEEAEEITEVTEGIGVRADIKGIHPNLCIPKTVSGRIASNSPTMTEAGWAYQWA